MYERLQRLGWSDGVVAWPKVCRYSGYVHFQLVSHAGLARNRPKSTLPLFSQLYFPTGSKEWEGFTPRSPTKPRAGAGHKARCPWSLHSSPLSARAEDNFHPFHKQGNWRQAQRGCKTDYRMSLNQAWQDTECNGFLLAGAMFTAPVDPASPKVMLLQTNDRWQQRTMVGSLGLTIPLAQPPSSGPKLARLVP